MLNVGEQLRHREVFEVLGVPLKREGTGELFPKSDQARTVLDALVSAARDAGVKIVTATRIVAVERGFVLNGSMGAGRVILASGGRSVPKTGSDGTVTP
jgi:predicted flavoprotein YhiN